MRLDDIVHRPLALKPRIGNGLQKSICGREFMQSVTVPLHIGQCAFHQVISIDFTVCSSCPRTVCRGTCQLSTIGGLRDGLISFSILTASFVRQNMPLGFRGAQGVEQRTLAASLHT